MTTLDLRSSASRHMAARVGRGAPLKVEGRMRRRKTVVAALLLSVFALTPLLRWDRGAHAPGQAVIADISRQTLYVFDLVFWPQDLPLVVGLLIASAAGLFAATALWGRVWCGFACPQSVWTDMFFAIEREVHRRIAQPTARKVVLDTVLLLLSAVTAVTFTAWFTDALALPGRLLNGTATAATWICIAVGTTTTFLLGAKARERVCLHMCPWPRFQSALLDAESLVVTYRRPRGEPRGKARLALRPDLTAAAAARSPLADTIVAARDDSEQALRGDCIDCGRCVAVCPTSVDIREGLQMGCIGCGLCIDACDSVMDKLDRPRGLIAFDHESSLLRAPAETAALNPRVRPRLIRAKTLLFGGIFVLAGALVLTGLVTRQTTFLSLEPGRNPPFVQLSDGDVRNDIALKLTLRGEAVKALSVRLEGAPGARLRLAEDAADAEWSRSLVLPLRDNAAEARLLVRRAAIEADARRDVTLVLADAKTGEERMRRDVSLWGPGPGAGR